MPEGGGSGRTAGMPAAAQLMHILGLLVDGTAALVGLKDLRGHYVFGNGELEALFGAQGGSLFGATDRDLMSATDAAVLEARDRAVAVSGQPTQAIDEFSAGKARLAYATVRFPCRDEGGVVIGTGFVAIDISQRVRAAPDTKARLDRAQRTIATLEHAVDEMRLRTATDLLTGALTRERMEDAVQREVRRRERYGHPASLVFIDLDRFKAVNDVHGHLAGDRVLREFCAMAQATMRATELLGRWGGEEFIVLLPNSGLTSARLLAERIRGALAEHRFPGVGQVTASFGIAELRPGESVADWIARADAGMYRAKAAGRNCVAANLPAEADRSGRDPVDCQVVRLVWNDLYGSGDPCIDAQHRGLFDDANTVLAATVGGLPADEIAVLVDDFIARIATHFRDEEAIFRAAGYQDADGHARLHVALLERAMHLSHRHAEGRLAAGELFEFLMHTIVARHICHEDRKFFPCLRKPDRAAP